jgi:AcrR family transcriptional regulator
MSITREKIIELGEDLIRTKGYNAFSYQDISTELGVKNAAIHYYFPTKANLGTSVIRTNIQRFEEMVDNMHSRGFDEIQQLGTFIKIYIKSHREQKICLVGALSSDYNTLNEVTQRELKKMIDLILQWLTNILTTGREKGLFAFEESPQDKAAIVFSGFVATLKLSRITDVIDFKNVCLAIEKSLIP